MPISWQILASTSNRACLWRNHGQSSAGSQGTGQHGLAAAEQKVEELKVDFTPEHPQVVKALGRVKDYQQRLRQRADGFIAGLEAKTSSLQESVKQMESEVEHGKMQDIELASRTRPYWDARRQIEEQKKQKIAIDLHEGLAQTLSAIKVNVESSSRGNLRDANAQPLEHIVPVLQNAIQEVRSIATELRPSSLDDLGLLPTILAAVYPAAGEPHNVRAAAGEDLVYVQGGDAWSRSTIEIVDMPRLGLRKTFVGTRSFATFPLDAAREAKPPGSR